MKYRQESEKYYSAKSSLPLSGFAAHGFAVAEVYAGHRACRAEDGEDDGEDGADAEQRVESEADQPHEGRAEDQLVGAGTALYAFAYWCLGHGCAGVFGAGVLGAGFLRQSSAAHLLRLNLHRA